MKKTFLLFATLFCVTFLYAQIEKIEPEPLRSNEEFFTQADLVFEGRQSIMAHTYNLEGNSREEDTYGIRTYYVTKVYKGDHSLEGKKIYLTFKGALLGEEKSPFNRDDLEEIIIAAPPFLRENGIPWVTYGSPAIFFFVHSDYPDDETSDIFHYQKYKFLTRDRLCIYKNKFAGLNNLAFKNRDELYNYMRQFEGFKVPEPAPQPVKQPEKEILNDPVIEIKYDESIIIFPQKGVETKKESNSKKKNQKGKTNNTITFQYANHKLSYDATVDKFYVTFDIMVSSNNPDIYFSQTVLEIQYNDLLFGFYAVSNNKVSFSMDKKFGSGYGASIGGWDNIILLQFGVLNNLNGPKRVALNSTPTALGTFKIELLPYVNSGLSYFSFTNTDFTLQHTFYSQTSNGSLYDLNSYDDCFFINSNTISISTKPTITNISPTSINAGIGNILTIKGTNFRAQKGKVLFSAADNGGETYLKDLDDYYYLNPKMGTPLQWNNNTIEVMVPSLVHKGYESGSAKHYSGGAGTGTIQIKTASGDSCVSSMTLQIPYSIKNDTITMDGVKKFQRIYLTRRDCDYDFLFTLAPSFEGLSNLSAMVAVIDTALQHWSELTGLILKLERKPNGELQYSDEDWPNLYKKYRIDRTSSINPQYGAMGSNTPTSKVVISGNTYLYCNSGSGILINPQPQDNPPSLGQFYWDYKISGKADTGKASFYQAFMHEVGHILLLGHVNQTSELMYYNIETGHNIITKTALAPTVSAVKDNISRSRSIKWEQATPSFPALYPVQALQSSFTVAKSCYGANNGSIKATITGGKEPYRYTWKKNGITIATTKNISNLAPGTYTLQMRDTLNCFLNDTIIVPAVGGGSPLTLNITKIPATSTTPELFKATVTGGVTPYTYKWTAGVPPIADTSIYKPAERGVGIGIACLLPSDYVNTPNMPTSLQTSSCKLTITVTDKNGCLISGSPSAAKGEDISIEAMSVNESAKEIVLFPNPTAGSFTISNITNATVYLYSALSGHINTFEHVSNNETINISHLANGIYFLKIIDGNTIKNEKLILTK